MGKKEEQPPIHNILDLGTERFLGDHRTIQNQINGERFLTFTREVLRLRGDNDVPSRFMWIQSDLTLIGDFDKVKSYSRFREKRFGFPLKGSFSSHQFATNPARGNNMDEIILRQSNWGDQAPIMAVVINDSQLWRAFKGRGTFQREDALYYYFIYTTASHFGTTATEVRLVKPEFVDMKSIPVDDSKGELRRAWKHRLEQIKKAKKEPRK